MPWRESDPRPASKPPVVAPSHRLADAFHRHRNFYLLAAALFFSIAVMFWR